MSLAERNDLMTAEAASWEGGMGSVGDYIALLKPRVMSLVVFTAFVGLMLAPGEIHPVIAAVALLCITIGAGASGALNMWFDADIDRIMSRTAKRPIPAGKITPNEALAFGLTLSVGSVLTLGLLVNWFAGAFLAFTIFFYVVIYTMWLKRSTPQNIVIGGAAGAFPPMIGWATVTGTITLDSLLLFAIIFMWTPPHSWALALYKSGDYSAAGVPMMPVAKGAKSTRKQILIYTGLYLAATAGPVLTGLGGLVYTGAVVLGGALFALLALRVFNSRAGDGNNAEDELYAVRAGDKAARDLFAYSIAHLTLLFAALLVEHGAGAFWALPSFGG